MQFYTTLVIIFVLPNQIICIAMNKLSADNYPSLITRRLTLRELEPDDYPEVFDLRSNRSLNEYIDRPALKWHNQAKSFIEAIRRGYKLNQWIYWGITLKEKNEIIGTVCLWNFNLEFTSCEIGCEILPKYQGKGLMTEAMYAVLIYGFENLPLESIDAFTHKDNRAVIKLLGNFGFRFDVERIDEENTKSIVFTLNKYNFRHTSF